MRVAVVGATGNAGTSLLRLLSHDPGIDSILGIARRRPDRTPKKVQWQPADIARENLEPLLRGADAVVHLAWAIQPSRDLSETKRINVEGSRSVFDAAAQAGVGKLVYASSVGAYSSSSKDRRRDETWPTEGVQGSFYSRQKAAVERILDGFEEQHPNIDVVRIRPALMFKRAAASEIRRLFLGPFVPSWLFRSGVLPFIPFHPSLTTQVVHSDDVAEAYRASLTRNVRGAFNLATEPLVTAKLVEQSLGTRALKIRPPLMSTLAQLTWKLRMHPTPSGWLEMGTEAPLMDTSRARRLLDWRPRHDASEVLQELVEGLRAKAGMATPPMESRAGGVLRNREIRSRVGGRNP